MRVLLITYDHDKPSMDVHCCILGPFIPNFGERKRVTFENEGWSLKDATIHVNLSAAGIKF